MKSEEQTPERIATIQARLLGVKLSWLVNRWGRTVIRVEGLHTAQCPLKIAVNGQILCPHGWAVCPRCDCCRCIVGNRSDNNRLPYRFLTNDEWIAVCQWLDKYAEGVLFSPVPVGVVNWDRFTPKVVKLVGRKLCSVDYTELAYSCAEPI